MDEEKKVISDLVSEAYDASEQPFGFVGEDQVTVLLCEPVSSLRSKTTDLLKAEGYLVTPAESAQEALRKMRYHTYDVVVVNELFDCDDPSHNLILVYLEELSMQVRRLIYVVLTGAAFRTMDNMTAFNRSVNLTINLENMDAIAAILKQGLAENRAFYRLFREVLSDVEGRN